LFPPIKKNLKIKNFQRNIIGRKREENLFATKMTQEEKKEQEKKPDNKKEKKPELETQKNKNNF